MASEVSSKIKMIAATILASVVFGFIVISLIGSELHWWALAVFAPFIIYFVYILKNPLIQVTITLVALVFFDQTVVSDYFLFDYLPISPSLIILATSLFSILALNRREKGLNVMPILWTFFLIPAIISVFIGGSGSGVLLEYNVQNFFRYFLEFFLFFVLGFIAFENLEEIKRIALVVVAIAGIMAFQQIIFEIIPSAAQKKLLITGVESKIEFSGFVGGITGQNVLYAILTPFAFILAVLDKSKIVKIITSLSLLFIYFSILLSADIYTLGFITLNTFLSVLFFGRKWDYVLKAAIAFVLIFLLTILMQDQLKIDSLNQNFADVESKSENEVSQIDYINSTINILAEYPFGVGLSEYNISQKLSLFGNIHYKKIPNSYLNFAIQTGLFGLIMFLLILFRVYLNVFAVFRLRGDLENREFFGGLFLLIQAYILMGIVYPIFFFESFKLSHILGLFLGIAFFASQKFKFAQIKYRQDY